MIMGQKALDHAAERPHNFHELRPPGLIEDVGATESQASNIGS
jgi:hypothetical protein